MYEPWFRLITTKILSDGQQSPRRITALRSWTDRVIALRQISVTALFYLENSKSLHPQEEERVGERASMWEGESTRFGSSFYMLFSSPGPALCKRGWPGVLFAPP